ncbi:UNVERIFIED_CONTAM: hypothetical protein K2H54_024909 [Gekko kuhli]
MTPVPSREEPVAKGGTLDILGSGVNLGESGLGCRGSEPKDRGIDIVTADGIRYVSRLREAFFELRSWGQREVGRRTLFKSSVQISVPESGGVPISEHRALPVDL